MATGYEDIDKLTAQQNSLLDDQQKKQQEIIKQQTQIQKITQYLEYPNLTLIGKGEVQLKQIKFELLN